MTPPGSDSMPDEPPAPGRSRSRFLPGPRLVVELAVLLSAVVAYETIRHRGEFPRPTIRLLRHGSPADRADAIRALSLYGPAGAEAIPPLLGLLRDDPDPSLRRGAAFVLGEVASGDMGGEPFSMSLLLAGSDRALIDESTPERAPPLPLPAAGRVASALLDAARDDPDEAVTRQALDALSGLLRGAAGTPPPRFFGPFRRMMAPEPEPPIAPRGRDEIPRWAFDAADTLASLASDDDPGLAHPAASWLFADPAADALLGEPDRLDALLDAASRSLRLGQPDHLDRLIVKAAALSIRDDPVRKPAFFALLSRAMASPVGPELAVAPASLPYPFWLAGPTAEQVRAHPAALDGMVRLLGIDTPPLPYAFWEIDPSKPTQTLLQAAIDDRSRADDIPSRDTSFVVLHAITRNPALLDLLGEHAGSIRWRNLLNAYVSEAFWPRLVADLVDSDLRPSLPADRASAAASHILDAVAELPDEPADPRRRGLALVSYFLKAVPPDSPSIARHAELLAALPDESEPETEADPAVIIAEPAPFPAPGN